MQSYDKENNVLYTQFLKSIGQIQDELEKPNVSYVTIGEIPKIGYEFETGGLRYRVIMSNPKKGRFTAEAY